MIGVKKMDKYTGEINIDNKKSLYPLMSKQEFLLDFNKLLEDINIKNSVFELKKEVCLKGMFFWIMCVFRDDKLVGVLLENSDEKLWNTYDNWFNEKNSIKRKSHDDWLIYNLNQPYEIKSTSIVFERNWGDVISYTDMKSGEIKIAIYYKK